MLRRLTFAGLLNALLLCGWGGVFAAVMCPHASARAADAAFHECCRARLTRQAAPPSSTHCHARTNEPGDAHEAHDGAQSSTDAVHLQDEAASHEADHGAQSSQPARAALAVQSSEGCAHCVRKPERQNSPSKARGVEGARREQSRPAQQAQAPIGFSFASFAPAVIPVQGSPPVAGRLHVLLNVFLI
ncbi:MAG TPA: hypothetical protein VFS10_17055 [Pyrinomonadaceae bacterium]|nr:hypothetical protein [Pyrinomonadaceae bacterium]